jgi:hypothetical protein
MRFAAAVAAYAFYKVAEYVINRRQGYRGSWPVGSVLLGLWAAYLLVVG